MSYQQGYGGYQQPQNPYGAPAPNPYQQQQPPPPASYGGYGGPPPPQVNAGYGAPPQQYNQPPGPAYGGPALNPYQQQQPPPPASYGAYGGPPPQVNAGYGAPPQQYNQPPQQPTYGQPLSQQPAYGQQPYGAQPPPPTYGAGANPPATYQKPAVKRQSVIPKAVLKWKPVAEELGTPTVFPCKHFDVQADTEAIRAATKENSGQSITNIICARSTDQRQQIRLTYKTMYGQDLMFDLRDSFSRNLHRTYASLMRTEAERDAHLIYKGMGDEKTILEILVSRGNEKLADVRVSFKEMYGKDLEESFKSGLGGAFQKLCIGLLQANRTPFEAEVNLEKCRNEAQALYDAGEGTWGTEKSYFNRLLCLRSVPQLRCIFQEYSKLCRFTIQQSIKREMSGNVRTGMLTIVEFVENHHSFFAKVLYKSMKGLGTDDRKLIRTIVTRCEYDLVEIKEEFQRSYNKSLAHFIKSECSGDYKNCLLMLIGDS